MPAPTAFESEGTPGLSAHVFDLPGDANPCECLSISFFGYDFLFLRCYRECLDCLPEYLRRCQLCPELHGVLFAVVIHPDGKLARTLQEMTISTGGLG